MTRRNRALAVVVYIFFLAGVCESLTRLALSVPRFANRIPVTENAWWRNSWVQRHARTGNEVFYDFDVYDPTRGWATTPNLVDRAAFDGKLLSTNSRGLRGKTEYAYDHPAGRVRILVLGDSFTFGDEVSDHETYCDYLQELLPGAEVINMGAHGYGHDQMLILLRQEGIKYRPDIVLLGFVSMDMPRNVLEFRDYAKPRFVVRGDSLRLTNTPVPPPEWTLAQKGPRSRALALMSALWERLQKATGLYDRDVEKTTTAILKEMAALSRSIGATQVVAYLPTRDDFSVPPSYSREQYLLATCGTIDDVRCFSVLPRLTRDGASTIEFLPGGHWGPEGHRMVAEAIRDFLVAEGLVARHGEAAKK